MPSPAPFEDFETSDLSTSHVHTRNEQRHNRNLHCMEIGAQQYTERNKRQRARPKFSTQSNEQPQNGTTGLGWVGTHLHSFYRLDTSELDARTLQRVKG